MTKCWHFTWKMHCGETPLWKRCSFNRIKSKKSIWVTCSFWNLKWETSWATQELSRTVVLSCFKCVLPFPLMKYLWKYVMDMSCLSTTHSQVQVCLANSWQQHTGCTFFSGQFYPFKNARKQIHIVLCFISISESAKGSNNSIFYVYRHAR